MSTGRHPLLARLRTHFFTGLVVLIPGIVSTVAVVWLFNLVTGGIPKVLSVIPDDRLQAYAEQHPVVVQVCGLGVVVLLTIGVGFLTTRVVGRRLIHRIEEVLMRLPVFSVVYSTVKQIGQTFSSSKRGMFQHVVLFEYPLKGVWVIGFVTGDAFREARETIGGDLISVFVPTTPNPTSGFLYFVPCDRLRFLQLSVTEAMRLIISGGVVRPDGEEEVAPVQPTAGTPPAAT